jgi:hypothetical protein
MVVAGLLQCLGLVQFCASSDISSEVATGLVSHCIGCRPMSIRKRTDGARRLFAADLRAQVIGIDQVAADLRRNRQGAVEGRRLGTWPHGPCRV